MPQLRRTPAPLALRRAAFAITLCFAASVSPSHVTAEYTSLLAGKPATHSSGVRRADVLTDGRAAEDGGFWKTRLTASLEDTSSFAEYDLGSVRHVSAAWLQGDNNDTYRVEGSLDGRAFSTLWDAEPVPHSGLQARSTQSLAAKARYVRVRPLQGDGRFTISEVQLFDGAAAELPLPAAKTGVPLSERLRDRTLLFGLSLLALLLVPARPRRWLLGLGLALVAVAGARFVDGVWEDLPVDSREVSLVRGMIACVGAAAIAREMFSPARWPASRVLCTSVLALCAALGIGAFYNLGHPQFWNDHQGRWSFAHLFDLRQYYPTAKYFAELSYVHIYDADLAAYAEQFGDQGLDRLAEQPVRDLETFEVVSVADRRAEIGSIRSHFTPERWAAYRADTDWFRRAMGDHSYLDTLIDYGGNATPVWMAIAHGLFSVVPPSQGAFTWMGLIDLALMLAAFIAIGRTFGVRTMLASALVFGANDFVMYGTNWSGATLRHDWLAYLAFGLCALRRGHTLQGGAWLGLATMIRAFPILALAGAALPTVFRVGTNLVRTRRLPRWSELQRDEGAILRVAAGALAAALISAGVSALILGPGSWIEWWAKVAKIESDPHPACVALRNLIAGTDDQARVLRARWPLYVGVMAVCSAAVAWLGRTMSIERAAVLGLCLVPVLFYPANYYLHFVYLLPLLAAERKENAPVLSARDAWVWLIVLGMCGLQYFTTLEQDVALHFYLSTVVLFAALGALLGVLLAHDEELRAWLARAQTSREREVRER
jgi:hypothetical protein